MSDDEPDTLAATAAAIHDHLDATAELPVDPTSSTYLGEAAAVARDADAAIREGQEAVARRRIQQVAALLQHVEDTGNPTADEHVQRAHQLAEQIAETADE